MSDKALLSIAEFGAVRQWLEAEAVGHEQTGRFLADMLDQLESLAAELAQRRAALTAEESQARSERERNETDLKTQREALAAAISSLAADSEQQREAWERRHRELDVQREALAAEESQSRQQRKQSNEEGAAQREALAAEQTQSREEWERRYSDLKAQREALATQRESLDAQRESLAADRQALATERAAFASERESLASEREQLQRVLAATANAAAPQGASLEPLQPILEEIRQGQAALHERLASDTTQSVELREALAQWTASRDQLLQQAERLAAAGAPATDTATAEQIRTLEQERTVLETELESVRNRAAETAETLAQQNRQMAEERSRWADELRRMRQTLELMAQRPPAAHEPGAPSISDSRPIASKAAGGGPSPADPVLDSVMAQFEMLQKDLARRRKSGANVQTA